MKIGFLRYWKTGPSLDRQRTVVQVAGGGAGGIHTDDQPPTRRTKLDVERQASPTMRECVISRLKPGDQLVVACAVVLGNSRADIGKVLDWVTERGAFVFDAEVGYDIKTAKAREAFIVRALGFLAASRSSRRTEAAREALAKRGGKRGPAKRALLLPRDELLAMWKNSDDFRPEDVARAAGVSRRQIYIEFKGEPRSS